MPVSPSPPGQATPRLKPWTSRFAKSFSWPLAFGLLLLLVAAVGVKLYFFPSEEPPEYVTATAALGDIEQSVLATGTVQASKQISVGAQASGQIRALHVALGDVVKKGQLIAEIDAMKQQNDLRNAEAALLSAEALLGSRQAALKQAELNFARQRDLLAADAIALLQQQPWPGNIRELRNVLEQASMMSDELHLGARHFAGLLPQAPASEPSAAEAASPLPSTESMR